MRSPNELKGFEYYLEPNWDDEGALAVPEYLLNNARVLLCGLPEYLPKGGAMAGFDGSIGVYWTKTDEHGKHAELYIDFRADGRVRLYSNALNEAQIVIQPSVDPEWIFEYLQPAFKLWQK